MSKQVEAIGPAESGSPETSKPVQIGGSVDDTSPVAANEGDVRRIRVTPEGNQIVELYKDNNALSPIAAMPGASEVKAVRETISNTTTRATAATPTSGKKIRIISVIISYDSTTATAAEVYFDTGTDIASDETKAIAESFMVSPEYRVVSFTWPDGGGPVGAANDVLSVREGTGVVATLSFVIHYREE